MSSNGERSTSNTAIGLPSPGQMSHSTTEKYPASADEHSYPEVTPSRAPLPMPIYSQSTIHQESPQHLPQPQPQFGQQKYQYSQDPLQETGKEVSDESRQKRIPWGLSPLVFGLIVALITALVVGGAVGGGVAGAMSGNDNDSSSNTSITTVTVTAGAASATTSATTSTTSSIPQPSSLVDFSVPEAYYVGSLTNPGCETSRVNTPRGDSFDLYCGVDMNNNVPSLEDSDKIVADFVALFAYSIEDCIYACMNSNYFRERHNQDVVGGNIQECRGITWVTDMAASNSSNYANCWLKNGTSNGFQCNQCISARLL